MLVTECLIFKSAENLIKLIFLLLWCLSTATVFAQTGPVCPGGKTTTVQPAYAEVGNPPNVGSWKKLSHLPTGCHVSTNSPALLTVSLAARFSHAGTIEDMAGRFGAISQTQGLKYWSATDNNWRVLVKDAAALQSDNKKSVREDFTAKEILGGQTLYFAQNDTRSWGLNVFSMHTAESSEDHLTVVSQNTRPVKLGPVRLFDSNELKTVVFISRADNNSWHYYSLAVVEDSTVAAPEKSLINRQAALYRYLTGQQPDGAPPLSP